MAIYFVFKSKRQNGERKFFYGMAFDKLAFKVFVFASDFELQIGVIKYKAY